MVPSHSFSSRCVTPAAATRTLSFQPNIVSVCSTRLLLKTAHCSSLLQQVVSVGLHEAAAEGAGAVNHAAFYLSLIGLGVAAPLQLYLLNATLASSTVSYAVPLYQALLIVMTTAAGGIFFGEFARISANNGAAFAVGSLVAMIGLGVLSSKDGITKEHEPLVLDCARQESQSLQKL